MSDIYEPCIAIKIIKRQEFDRFMEDKNKIQYKDGITGYCGCCGAPSVIGKEQIHEEECIWFKDEDE